MKKILFIILFSAILTFNVNAGTDGENALSKKSDNSVVKDCFEGFNRASFALNQGLDKIIFKPAASVYRTLPAPIRSGTSNFISNLSLVVTIPNNLLQGDIFLASKNTGRFLINSTIGIVGLFDPATKFGLNDYEKEDYGQTLGKWGVGEGCYLVLPVIGPSTARDATASLVNFMGGDAWYNITVDEDTHYVSDFDYYASRVTAGIDFRAKNFDSIENLEKNSIDFYASVKSLYLQDRKRRIQNLDSIIETQNDSDWEEIDPQ